MTPNILETNVFAALRTFLLTLVSIPVIRTPVNRAAMPLGDFIALSPAGMVRLETNTDLYPSETSETTLQPTQINIRVDCYGASAMDTATTITALFRDDLACQSFQGSGFDIAPLYTTDPTQMPMTTGEDQYLERWTFECAMQYNPIITSAILTTGTVPALNIVNVDVIYPA